MHVVIEIDELVLLGLPPGDRDRVARAMEAALTRCFLENGAPDDWADRSTRRLNAGGFRAADGRAGTIGRGAAEAVYRAVAAHAQRARE